MMFLRNAIGDHMNQVKDLHAKQILKQLSLPIGVSVLKPTQINVD